MKPVLKWVGGKTQIIDKILEKFPKEMDNYHEPFIGGGSVLIALLQKEFKIKGNIYAYDSNPILIDLYKDIQSNCEILQTEIDQLKTFYTASHDKEAYYYLIRNEFNSSKKSIKKSAMFIFLNKTCFRGLFRTGPNGFNVPYGNYKNPEIIDKNHLLGVSNLIKNVIFECLDFKESIGSRVSHNDFMYLDPPYVPVSSTSFVGYNKKGFNEHTVLFDLIKSKNTTFVLSNSNTTLVRESFNDLTKYKVEVIVCKSRINSKNPESIQTEVIIFI